MSVSLDEHRLGGLRWIVLRGSDLGAFRALGEHMRDEMAALTASWPLPARDHQPVTIPLPDLAEGNPHRQLELATLGDGGHAPRKHGAADVRFS